GNETVLTPVVTGAPTVYDKVGHVVETRRLRGIVVSLVNGETAAVSDGTVVATSTSVYSDTGLLTRTTDAAGRTIDNEYNSLGQRTARIDAPVTINGVSVRHRTETGYDEFGRTKAQYTNIAQSAGGSTDRSQARQTTYDYDPLGRRVRTTFADDTFTETHSDKQGRVTAEVDPLGLTKSYEYD